MLNRARPFSNTVFALMRHRFVSLLVLVVLLALAWSVWAGGVEFALLDPLKALVAAAAIGVVACRSLGRGGLAQRSVYLASLSLIAALAWVVYFNFFAFHGIGRERVFIHLHDVAHYYLGSKYFPPSSATASSTPRCCARRPRNSRTTSAASRRATSRPTVWSTSARCWRAAKR
jgi:hypothetical protein